MFGLGLCARVAACGHVRPCFLWACVGAAALDLLCLCSSGGVLWFRGMLRAARMDRFFMRPFISVRSSLLCPCAPLEISVFSSLCALDVVSTLSQGRGKKRMVLAEPW